MRGKTVGVDGSVDGDHRRDGGEHGEWDDAGEPVCFLNRVCPECGRVREDGSLDHCAHCGIAVVED
ncbi:MAG TPA: hypothetical protein VFG87_17050 [Amycolatopsis sp.]|nr:hypothetical protein [Amycolatopsis sp.]